ncbi:MAG: hypothetical protein ABR583_02185 [Gaiellaceae bacterium]
MAEKKLEGIYEEKGFRPEHDPPPPPPPETPPPGSIGLFGDNPTHDPEKSRDGGPDDSSA